VKDLIALMRGYVFRTFHNARNSRIDIGKGLKLYCKLEIRGKGRVSIGADCVITGVPGDNRHYVTLYTHSSEAIIKIGDHARIFAGRISSKFEITIGDDLLIEEAGIMDTDFHTLTSDRGTPHEDREQCRIHIGNRVSIGARSVITKGVTIGDEVMIYPGSIVNRNVPSSCTIVGNPGKPLRTL
jgi:acetyltransferase-like isoleucine patch superfamily enzyme